MGQSKEVWIADDDKSIRWMLEKAMKREGLKVRLFSDADQLIVALKVGNPDLVLSDIDSSLLSSFILGNSLFTSQP